MKIRKIIYDIKNNIQENSANHILALYVLFVISIIL
jgi:hypothetical protein